MENSRTALITGASSGLGSVFARKLAARGYNLILVARRGRRLESLIDDLPGPAVSAEFITADLTAETGLSAVESAIRSRSDLELLVNNAGFGTQGRFWETDPAGQEQMYRLHVLATMRLSRAALEVMTRRAAGGIINVSSIAAFAQSPGNVSYCSTKAWMNSFTEGLAIELRRSGSPVRMQALCPGYTVTEFHDTLGIDRKLIPAFLWMSADDVVNASLRGLDRGKVIVIPGWKYKVTAAVMRHLPWPIRSRAVSPGKDARL